MTQISFFNPEIRQRSTNRKDEINCTIQVIHVSEFLTVAAEAVPRDKTTAIRIFSFSMAAGEQANASLAAYIHRTPLQENEQQP